MLHLLARLFQTTLPDGEALAEYMKGLGDIPLVLLELAKQRVIQRQRYWRLPFVSEIRDAIDEEWGSARHYRTLLLAGLSSIDRALEALARKNRGVPKDDLPVLPSS